MQVEADQRQYSLQDLEQDFACVLGKFVATGGLMLRTLQERHLKRGAISGSRHRDDIIEALMATVLENHEISGTGDKGVNVRSEAEDAVKFFAANNVRQGPVAVAFEKLARRLRLR
jgi:hypothetical protein